MESMTDWAFSWPISVGGTNSGVSAMGCDTERGLGSRIYRTLVIVNNIPQMVATAVVCFAHAHRVVGEVDIAVVAEDYTETCALVLITCLALGVVFLHFGILNALFWVPLGALLC